MYHLLAVRLVNLYNCFYLRKANLFTVAFRSGLFAGAKLLKLNLYNDNMWVFWQLFYRKFGSVWMTPIIEDIIEDDLQFMIKTDCYLIIMSGKIKNVSEQIKYVKYWTMPLNILMNFPYLILTKK